MSKNLNQLVEEFTQARSRFQAQAQDLFKVAVREFFERVPEVTVIKWAQFTPYFSDGDPCVFSVHSPSFSNTADPDRLSVWGELEDEAIEGEWAFDGNYAMPDVIKKDSVKLKAVNEFREYFDNPEMEDVFEAMFGDHVAITVTRDGIDISDHEHD